MPRAAPTWGALLRRDRVYSTAGRPQIRLFGGHARDETEHAIHWASEAAHRFIAEYIAETMARQDLSIFARDLFAAHVRLAA